MTDDPTPLPDRRDSSVYLDAIEHLRSDVREDIGHLRDDVREDVKELRDDLSEFIVAHGKDHAGQKLESELAHTSFELFIHNFELAQARKDGVLGVFRFILEQLTRHGKGLAIAGGSIAATAAALSGAFQIEVVIR